MANSDCKKVLSLIPLYIDNMLSDKEADVIYRHLDSCESCKKEFEFMNSLMDKTKKLPQVDVSSDFHENLMAKIESATRNKKAKRYLMLRRVGAGVAAAAVVALSVVAFNNLNVQKDSTNPDQYIAPNPNISDNPMNLTAPEAKEITAPVTETHRDFMTPDTQTDFQEDVPKKQASSGGGSSAAPKADAIAEINISEESLSYTIVTITVTDETANAVSELLSSYEKDETGYIIPDIKTVSRKLAELGVTVESVVSDTITKNYIIVK